MHTEREEINGIVIFYDTYAKREIEEYGAWIPLSYEIASAIFRFVNDNFFYEKNKPEISVSITTDRASYRAIELSVRIKETGYGEAELFTMDIFSGRYGSARDQTRNFVNGFMERFQKNIIRSAVMDKIELFRNPPKPVFDWFTIKMTGVTMGRTAMKLATGFVILAIFIIYLCLSR